MSRNYAAPARPEPGEATGNREETPSITDYYSGGQVRTGRELDLPIVGKVLSELDVSVPVFTTTNSLNLPLNEQGKLLNALQDILHKAEANEETSKIATSHALVDEQPADDKQRERSLEDLGGVSAILDKLWECKSKYMAQAAEVLADRSRNPLWRISYGQAGILGFFLRIVASKGVDDDVLLHSLRLIGNSCADTDINRQIVVEMDRNCTAAVLRLLHNPALIYVAIPVLYNICVDFEPAQCQVAANRASYILLSLITDRSIEDDSLLDYSCELIEMLAEIPQGVDCSPEGTIVLLIDLATNNTTVFPRFACLVNCLTVYLRNERFQNVCIEHKLVDKLLSVLRWSYAVDVDESCSGDVQLLAQMRLKISQALSDVSALPQFAEAYPLDSRLSKTLVSWLHALEDQLQICACIMLGNLARSDVVCVAMVQNQGIHQLLLSILKSNVRGSVLHAALGVLKNLAIPVDNRTCLGDAGIIPAVSRIWVIDTVPQVQFSAASLVRLVTISSIQNISQLLGPTPPTPPILPGQEQTYLSLLLSFFRKTDSIPIKTEVGRTIASLCRTLHASAREGNDDAQALTERLFDTHTDVAHPLWAMIVQSEWPVVRSEGWFALALMASTPRGSAAVVGCLDKVDGYLLLEETIQAEVPEPSNQAEGLQKSKDRDNVIILVKELLKKNPINLSDHRKALLEDLMKKIARSSSQ